MYVEIDFKSIYDSLASYSDLEGLFFRNLEITEENWVCNVQNLFVWLL